MQDTDIPVRIVDMSATTRRDGTDELLVQVGLSTIYLLPTIMGAIADKIGVSQPTISKWSRLEQTGSISEPEFRKMARLARVLNVSLEDLAWRDLRREPPRAPSQDSGLDVSKLAGLIEAIEATVTRRGKKSKAD